MSVVYQRAKTATHEARHSAAFILQGHLPRVVTADWPSASVFGATKVDWPNGVGDHAEEIAIPVLAGPDWDESWPPGFPPDREAVGDERQLAAAVRLLKLDEAGYRSLIERAEALMATRAFNRICALIGRALELKDELTADDLDRLVGDLADPIREQEPTHAA